MQGRFRQKSPKILVLIPDGWESDQESGSLRIASTAGNFFWDGGPRFCWGFWRKRVVGCGVFVVKLWWIAGESW
jgi:hypothetical protein